MNQVFTSQGQALTTSISSSELITLAKYQDEIDDLLLTASIATSPFTQSFCRAEAAQIQRERDGYLGLIKVSIDRIPELAF